MPMKGVMVILPGLISTGCGLYQNFELGANRELYIYYPGTIPGPEVNTTRGCHKARQRLLASSLELTVGWIETSLPETDSNYYKGSVGGITHQAVVFNVVCLL